MDVSLTEKSSVHKLMALLLAVLLCTYLRISLLLIYPFVTIILFLIFNWKLKKNGLYFFSFLFFIWIFSFRNGFFLKYNLVSFYYYLPFFLLFFASPQVPKENSVNYLKMFMTALAVVAAVNNIPGILQYIKYPNDDSFVGIYGEFTVSQNGLSILNGILFFYFFINYQQKKKRKYIFLSLFFLICCIMGFYGAGLLSLIAALTLTYFRVKLKYIIQLVLIAGLTIGIIVLLMRFISPLTLDYNLAILKKFLDPSSANAPRKIVIFQNYLKAYPPEWLDLLFGSGPGTFNSRSAFMVGSPTYFNVGIIKSSDLPHYFQTYAFPLWNPSNTGPYDGFMNQPFSSLLAMLGEYGLLVTAFLAMIFTKQFRYFVKIGKQKKAFVDAAIAAKIFKFCCLFAAILIVIDNYVEYPEIIALVVIIIKLSQYELKRDGSN